MFKPSCHSKNTGSDPSPVLFGPSPPKMVRCRPTRSGSHHVQIHITVLNFPINWHILLLRAKGCSLFVLKKVKLKIIFIKCNQLIELDTMKNSKLFDLQVHFNQQIVGFRHQKFSRSDLMVALNCTKIQKDLLIQREN